MLPTSAFAFSGTLIRMPRLSEWSIVRAGANNASYVDQYYFQTLATRSTHQAPRSNLMRRRFVKSADDLVQNTEASFHDSCRLPHIQPVFQEHPIKKKADTVNPFVNALRQDNCCGKMSPRGDTTPRRRLSRTHTASMVGLGACYTDGLNKQ